jgi:cytochrome c-type protein NapB
MSDSPEHQATLARSTGVFLSGVIALAAVGYFVGISDGVPQEDAEPMAMVLRAHHSAAGIGTAVVLPATSYAEMRRSETGPTSRWSPALDQIPQPAYDQFAEIKPSEAEKQQSTLTRASRRAFNGAPPVVPHAVERTDDAACYACHGQGMRIEDRVANRMSHGFLANCLQCHGAPPPQPFADADATVENSFVGLAAPLEGARAFPGAPPTIPHSTWMRDQCLACHSRQAGWAGLESTHPWRRNCQQCHAPSAVLDQAVAANVIGFLPAPVVSER